ncbi:MAG: lipocalin family protein [Rhodospirillaceae bacterium]|nr:lipocalin family protein [Rhodospirillaceae bacterium]
MKRLLIGLLTALLPGLSACTGVPDGVTPVTRFDVSRYLGTWYEIARLDHRFERGLVAVSATYTLNSDGSLKVVNRGYDPKKCAWRESTGRAKFMADPNTGHLAVSFFGPFYGGYTVFALDHDAYAWAMVSGPSRDYLWILSRTPTLPDAIRTTLVEQAHGLGFPTDGLITVQQSVPPC